jgi:hypothetical protein
VLTAAECAAAGGSYAGDGTNCATVDCPPADATGICCLPEGGVLMTEAECNAAGGIWGGPGSTSESFPCETGLGQLFMPATTTNNLFGALWDNDPANLFEEVVPMTGVDTGPLKAKNFSPLHTQEENVFPYIRTRCYRIHDPLNLAPSANDRVLLSFDISRAVPPPVNPPRSSENHVMPYIVIAVYPAPPTLSTAVLRKP